MDLQVDFEFFMFGIPLESLVGVKGDERHWAFTPLGVSTSHDCNLQNIGVGNQLLLNGQARCVLRRSNSLKAAS